MRPFSLFHLTGDAQDENYKTTNTNSTAQL